DGPEAPMPNPFPIHGPVGPDDLADREAEVARVLGALREPGAKLLVYGPRRMGKTSILSAALARHEAEGGSGLLADFSTASSPADMTNRLLEGASRALGRRWRDYVDALLRRTGIRLSVGADPVTGLPTASLELAARREPEEAQRDTLAAALDALESLAADRGEPLGVMLDEFQEIHRHGGEEAEWHLRGVIQHHRHLSYVLAGSKTHLIERMLGEGRAFYKLLDLLHVGPIEPGLLAEWIDARLEAAGAARAGGAAAAGVGRAAIELAGPRTRDVIRLARAVHDRAGEGAETGEEAVAAAFGRLVREGDEPHRTLWERLTPPQQNLLRAVAAAGEGLTTAETMRRFGLTSSGAVSGIVRRFVEEGLLAKGGPSGYRFDDPYFRGWVVLNALPDLGLELPVTFRP
ncbi:MAG: AAA family ATPase, partial [Gemmatimonadota bacterium]